MKIPVILTVLILAVGALWGGRVNQHLTILREKHRRVLHEMAKLGIPANPAEDTIATRAGIRPCKDDASKVREMAADLAALAREMKKMHEIDSQPDEAIQKRIMQLKDDMLSLNRDELKLLIAELKDRTDMDDRMRLEMISSSIMMLADISPESAIALFTDSDDPVDNLGEFSIVLFRFAEAQPLAALEWIKKNAEKQPELVSDNAWVTAISAIARTDFALAFQLIDELKVAQDRVMIEIANDAVTPEQQTELLKALRRAVANSNDKKSAENLFSEGMRSLYWVVGQSGYENAMKWLDSADLSAEEAAGMAEHLYCQENTADTEKWLDWLSTQTLNEMQAESVARHLVARWTDRDYVAAGEWLARSPAGLVKEYATVAYLHVVAPYEPDVAAQWASTLPPEKQDAEMRRIHAVLKQKDMAAAGEFASRHGLEIKE